MDGFSYSDIFATKGIEYLVIIAFLAMLIPFWMFLNKQEKITSKIHKALGALSAAVLRIPKGLFYSRNHLWMHMERTGEARLGMDDLLLHLTGKVKLSNLRYPGEIVNKGDLLLEIDQKGKLLRLYSPVSGKIEDTNSDLNETNGMLHDDPYGKGWIYKIKPSNWISDTRTCYFAEDAVDLSVKDLDRFKDFLARTMKDYTPETARMIMQDGGELIDHSLAELPDEIWQEFQNEFLSPERI